MRRYQFSLYAPLLLSSPEILLSQELSEVNACLSHAATVVTTKYKTSIVSDPAVEDSQVIWIYSQHVIDYIGQYQRVGECSPGIPVLVHVCAWWTCMHAACCMDTCMHTVEFGAVTLQ